MLQPPTDACSRQHGDATPFPVVDPTRPASRFRVEGRRTARSLSTSNPLSTYDAMLRRFLIMSLSAERPAFAAVVGSDRKRRPTTGFFHHA